jgi:hypothetical protein
VHAQETQDQVVGAVSSARMARKSRHTERHQRRPDSTFHLSAKILTSEKVVSGSAKILPYEDSPDPKK